MITFLKPLLAFLTVVGGCCAIGIPVANSLGKSLSKSASSIKKCESDIQSGWEEIDFGGEKVSNVCWSIENNSHSGSSGVSDITEDQKYSDLFKATWDIKDGKWDHIILKDLNREDGELWTFWCEHQHTGWALPEEKAENEKFYLGICNKQQTETTSWAEVDIKADSKLTIKVCQGDKTNCWSDASNRSTQEENQAKIQHLNQTALGNWYTIRFKKQKGDQTVSK